MLMLLLVLHNTKKEAKKLLQKYVAFSAKTDVLLHFFSTSESIVAACNVF